MKQPKVAGSASPTGIPAAHTVPSRETPPDKTRPYTPTQHRGAHTNKKNKRKLVCSSKSTVHIAHGPYGKPPTGSQLPRNTYLVAPVGGEEHGVTLGGLRRGKVGHGEVPAADARVAVDALENGLDGLETRALGSHREGLVLGAAVLGVADGHAGDHGVHRLLVLGLLDRAKHWNSSFGRRCRRGRCRHHIFLA